MKNGRGASTIIKYILLAAVIITGSIAGWLYYPQYQISQMKKQSLEASSQEISPTYIDYYSGVPKNSLYHLALGDSIIRGVGASKNQNFVCEFSKELGKLTNKEVNFQNEGISGMTSSELKQLMDARKFDEEIKKADIITVNIGGNDVLRAAKEQDFQSAFKAFDSLQQTFTQNLADISARITEINPAATIVFLELYNPLNPDTAYYGIADKLLPKWNVNIYRTAKNIPAALVIETSKVINGQNLQNLAPDGVHPNSLGYKAIASQIIEQFRTSLKKAAV
ncbi:GDSL-type esterase/lipase family protein [Bacillus sp. FJAT-27445]|uniref:GDSL-type esterase/lipase family protein n=1 Tax=Bacillus sp. FJAT-27445 TaxID=1679166 RepID=UPI000743A3A6|nr:GDSL-type esterase/lipase family protein [Bacillus sp. FJAT-27445]